MRSKLRLGAEVAGRAAMNLSGSKSLCAWSQRLLRYAQRRFFNNEGPPLRRTARARVDWTAERSMQPLRRFRLLGLSADSKAFARGRKRPTTEPAALVHCVPAALDPTNVGLPVVDVVKNEIIHRDHLTGPRAVGQLTYRDDKMDRNGSKDLLLVHQGTRCQAHRAAVGRRKAHRGCALQAMRCKQIGVSMAASAHVASGRARNCCVRLTYPWRESISSLEIGRGCPTYRHRKFSNIVDR